MRRGDGRACDVCRWREREIEIGPGSHRIPLASTCAHCPQGGLRPGRGQPRPRWPLVIRGSICRSLQVERGGAFGWQTRQNMPPWILRSTTFGDRPATDQGRNLNGDQATAEIRNWLMTHCPAGISMLGLRPHHCLGLWYHPAPPLFPQCHSEPTERPQLSY